MGVEVFAKESAIGNSPVLREENALPLISVIIPIYQAETYLERCLESICNQTYRNLQIILVDDGSPDKCPALCDSRAGKDSRISVIHQPNQGVSSARNKGMDMAEGEYIAFIDADDYILPDYYTHLYGLITDNQADMAMCKHLVVDSDGLAVPALLFSTGIREGVYTGKDIFDKGFLVYVWGKLFKRELCLKYRFPENRQIVEDTLWLCCLLPDCNRVSVSRKRMYRYTRHRDSASHEMLYALNEKKMNDIMEASMELYRYFKALRIIW